MAGPCVGSPCSSADPQTFGIIYIPVISQTVFQVAPLGWEWCVALRASTKSSNAARGLIAAAVIVYLILAELYKLVIRSMQRKEARADSDKSMRLERTIEPSKLGGKSSKWA